VAVGLDTNEDNGEEEKQAFKEEFVNALNQVC
jgi:hypothetical protein